MNEKRSEAVELFVRLQVLSNRYQKQLFQDGNNPNNGQGRILSLLKMKPEITQKELTDLSGMTKQSVAQLLDKLEKRGYITRSRSEEDRRIYNIKLTAEGASALSEMDDTPHQRQRGKGFDCLNEEELDNFIDYMTRVNRRMENLIENNEIGGNQDDKDR
jgi:DNA-binding MarR family transcriptional regulator